MIFDIFSEQLFWCGFNLRYVPVRRPVAQLAEHRSPKPKVGGSMPSWPAIMDSVKCVASLKQNKTIAC